ncbi:MAG: malic enzyme-like NAD(P)-binding protein [bacterium]
MLAELTNQEDLPGDLASAISGKDIFIGVSAPGIVTEAMIKSMNAQAIVFALANPVPEIMPDLALANGALVVATGRSDFSNQVNNALVFPGIFRGALDRHIKNITIEMQINAAIALAKIVTEPTAERIIPGIFEKGILEAVVGAIR